MSDVTATLRLESPDLALTETVAHDETATVQPITGAGTVPAAEGYLFTISSADFDAFEAGLERDGTVAAFERVIDAGGEAVYRFEYADDATLFSPLIAAVDGVSLDWTNDGTAWTVRIWLPDRSALSTLRERALERDVDFSLRRVDDYAEPVETDWGLTDHQGEALLLAFEMGYFEEPRESTLEDVAAELGVSQPAAGGLLRRGMRQLVVSTLGEAAER
ncbi:MAG: helix-turn-helix domain-containing protein [Haloferacaceae archaeon]